MAKIISMSLLGNKLYLEFDEAMTNTSPNTTSFYLGSTSQSVGISSLSGDSTSSWVITLDTSIASSDYLAITNLRDVAKSTANGVGLSNTSNFYMLGTDGVTNLNISETPPPFANSSVLLGNGSDVVSLSGKGGCNVDLSETVKSSDTVRFVDNGVLDYDSFFDIDDSTYIKGFDVSGSDTNDKLDLPSAKIAANVTNFNGIDVGTIASHSIVDGIATFKDSAGNVLVIDTDTELLQATQYLNRNLAQAGATVAFNFSLDSNGLGVFQKGALNSNYSLLFGMDGLAGATLSNTAGLNKVQIVDSTAPLPDHAEASTKGIDIYFSEDVASASVKGLHLYKNGLTDMGALSTTVNGSIVSVNSSQTLAATDFVVTVIDPTFSYQATDSLGNTSSGNDLRSSIALGGVGDNLIDLSSLAGVVRAYGDAGNDTIKASTRGSEELSGDDGNDVLIGSSRASVRTTLIGGDGNDTLDSGAGYSSMDGGAGNDTYIVRTYGASYYENNDSGTDIVQSYLQYLTLNSNIENLRIMSSGAANGIGNELNNIIYAGAGNNVIDGLSGIDTVSYAAAVSGVNVNLTNPSAQATGGSGSDTLVNIENLQGSNFNDVLIGNAAANVLQGGSGNDHLSGAGGADQMFGEAGDDAYVIDHVGDKVTELVNSGIDKVYAYYVNYTLTSNVENLQLMGTASNSGTGNELSNIIQGNSGSNLIAGGLGNDTLSGGVGQDSFVFNTTLNAISNKDTITDFNVVDDTVRLENAIFTKLTALGTLATSYFCSNASGTAADSNDFICYNTATGVLSYDADGNGAGASVAFAMLGTTVHPALTAADFVVI